MSPEQLLGKEVDERADVYAAGVVLYEMATGRRPFGETSGPQLVAKILNEPMPAPREVNPEISPQFEQAILKATDKDRELRHQTAKELLVDLERLGARPTTTSARTGGPCRGPAGNPLPPGGAATDTTRPWPLRPGWLIAAGALVALIALLLSGLRPVTPRITSFRTLDRRAHDFRGLATDGVHAYFAESRTSTDAVFAIPLAGGEPRQIPLPWSGLVWVQVFDVVPDPPALLIGRETTGGEPLELWRLPLGGGSPSRIESLPAVNQAMLSRRGDRIAYVAPVDDPKGHQALFVVGLDGSAPRRLAGPHQNVELGAWRPGDETLRFLSTEDVTRFWEVSATGPARRLEPPTKPGAYWGSRPDWTPDGRFFVWVDEGVLLARDERPLFRPGDPRPATRLAAPSDIVALRFTPDGRRIVALRRQPGTEVVRFDHRTRDVTPLLGGARAGVAEFSPDGAWIAWVSSEGGWGRLWRSRPDGSSPLLLTEPKRLLVPALPPVRWSRDGRRIAFTAYEESKVWWQLFVVDAETGAIERPGPEEPGVNQVDPCWESDGRALIYSAAPTPTTPDSDVYIRRLDLSARRVAKLPGSEGLWGSKCSRDGRILASDHFAQRAEPGARTHFKLREPHHAEWTALVIEAENLNYPTWSRDGRFVYATSSPTSVDGLRTIVRIDVATRRVETIARIDGLRADLWMDLMPDGVPMVHRDVSQREIVVMDWEAR
jgi:Tol biopolymer transport system component